MRNSVHCKNIAITSCDIVGLGRVAFGGDQLYLRREGGREGGWEGGSHYA